MCVCNLFAATAFWNEMNSAMMEMIKVMTDALRNVSWKMSWTVPSIIPAESVNTVQLSIAQLA
jgi:adenine deaminase